MLCDSPTNYESEQECTNYIADIPTVWDQTIVLDGKMGEYCVTARRKGNDWYIGGITNWTARDITIDLSFLPDGDYVGAGMLTVATLIVTPPITDAKKSQSDL